MHDPWIEKLSDYIDGRLGEDERRALEAHLDGCMECSAIADDLRAVVAAAQHAPVLEPPRDLWPGIAARITDATPVLPLRAPQLADIGGMRRRFSFSMPQLAAAAVLLMALTGTGVWVLAGGSAEPASASGTIIQSAGPAPRSTGLVAEGLLPPAYVEDVTGLERALAENSADLDPATVEIVQRSLESIDRAISDAQAALAADPGNPYLHRQLDNTMQKKIDVLRRATGARRARS